MGIDEAQYSHLYNKLVIAASDYAVVSAAADGLSLDYPDELESYAKEFIDDYWHAAADKSGVFLDVGCPCCGQAPEMCEGMTAGVVAKTVVAALEVIHNADDGVMYMESAKANLDSATEDLAEFFKKSAG